MSESDAVQARLYAHVESILNGAAFRRRDRDDLAEELYGHLWQRWQDALASGLDEEAAADQAIRSFGEPARLGRDVTLAYHSRLYASTVGVLVPTVADAKGKPRGYWLIYFLVFTTFWVMAYGQAAALKVIDLPKGANRDGAIRAVAMRWAQSRPARARREGLGSASSAPPYPRRVT